MEYTNIFGYIGICLSSCFYCSLAFPFLKVLSCKLNFEYTPIALINTIYVDSICWYIYADKILSDQLKLCQIIGACSSLILIFIYLIFELKKYLVDSILNCLILILGTLVLHKGLTIVIEDTQMVGKICFATKLITFFTPFFQTVRVIKEKNYKLISINITMIYMAACIGWVLFGKATNDLYIMCPNGIGVILCLIQFLIYLNYKKNYGKYAGPSSTIGIESTSTEDVKKDESTNMNIDYESQEKGKEKPVKIVTRTDN